MLSLPVELVEEIVDYVAECHPEWLPSCVLVSHQWNPRATYHLYRIFRTITITTSAELHAFAAIVKNHPGLAAFATSLVVSPDPHVFESDLATTSYIPFHHLSSLMLRNVRRLTLGENLRWGEYPLVYRKSIAGFFSEVVALDVSCHFSSVSELFRVIWSFGNVKDVRLLYPHHDPPRWISYRTHTPRRDGALSRETFNIQNLELSFAILKPALDVCGDSVVNLSVVCPQMSTLPDVPNDGQRPAFACSLISLRTVKITVPVESDGDGSANRPAGLRKLFYLLIAPITQPDVLYSLFLVQCEKHNAVGYRMEDTSKTKIRRLIEALATLGPLFPEMERCQECPMTKYQDILQVLPEWILMKDQQSGVPHTSKRMWAPDNEERGMSYVDEESAKPPKPLVSCERCKVKKVKCLQALPQ